MGLMDFKGFVYQCWYCNKLFKPEQVLRICNKAKDSESSEFGMRILIVLSLIRGS